ncbi:MAG TPA: hypothetical protein VNJ02_06790 [Vicinamibacterales bacterium]|nr:hypothetical protein [Vicinamibacterales bacterium]
MTARRPDAPDVALADHAAESLQFIRQAMERSSTFTAVPGYGGVAMGVVGLVAAGVAALQPSAERWLLVWLAAAVMACAICIGAMRVKAHRAGLALTGAASRRFALALAAPLVAGSALTVGLWLSGAWALMPSVWLLLYGTGALTGGAFSVAPVRALGLAFMTLGCVALVTPPSWGNVWLALGFGALQCGFGIYIARKYGG